MKCPINAIKVHIKLSPLFSHRHTLLFSSIWIKSEQVYCGKHIRSVRSSGAKSTRTIPINNSFEKEVWNRTRHSLSWSESFLFLTSSWWLCSVTILLVFDEFLQILWMVKFQLPKLPCRYLRCCNNVSIGSKVSVSTES